MLFGLPSFEAHRINSETRRIELIIQEASYAADQRQVEINLALSDVHEFPNLETDTFKVEVGFIHDITVRD